jgi:aryl-alcohol dehydrogenase-like predicted oxidoreductase
VIALKYRLLGNSGLRVSEVALGTMTFGEDWGWGSSKEEARKIYDTFRSSGGNFIDTANVYTNGTSEEFVGEFIHDHRQSVVLATKYTCVATTGCRPRPSFRRRGTWPRNFAFRAGSLSPPSINFERKVI